MEISEDELIGKSVMSGKGFLIGVIKESVLDDTSGETTSVLVEPSKEVVSRKYKFNEQGDIIFPFNSLVAVKDVIIVEESDL